MKDQLLNIQKEAKEKIQNLHSLEDLEKFRIEFMGKKGKLTSILRGMGGLSKEERPIIGKLANEVREAIESELGKMKTSIEEKILLEKLEKDKLDITTLLLLFLSKKIINAPKIVDIPAKKDNINAYEILFNILIPHYLFKVSEII